MEIGSRLRRVEKKLRANQRDSKLNQFGHWSTEELRQSMRHVLGLCDTSEELKEKRKQISLTGRRSNIGLGDLLRKLVELEVISETERMEVSA